MNEVEKAIINHKYSSAKDRKKLFIYLRTKNRRIKNKCFSTLLFSFMREKKVAIIGEVVLMDDKYYAELKRVLHESDES